MAIFYIYWCVIHNICPPLSENASLDRADIQNFWTGWTQKNRPKERMKAGKMTGLSYGVCARQGECGGGRVEQADVGNTRTGQSGK